MYYRLLQDLFWLLNSVQQLSGRLSLRRPFANNCTNVEQSYCNLVQLLFAGDWKLLIATWDFTKNEIKLRKHFQFQYNKIFMTPRLYNAGDIQTLEVVLFIQLIVKFNRIYMRRRSNAQPSATSTFQHRTALLHHRMLCNQSSIKRICSRALDLVN